MNCFFSPSSVPYCSPFPYFPHLRLQSVSLDCIQGWGPISPPAQKYLCALELIGTSMPQGRTSPWSKRKQAHDLRLNPELKATYTYPCLVTMIRELYMYTSRSPAASIPTLPTPNFKLLVRATIWTPTQLYHFVLLWMWCFSTWATQQLNPTFPVR